LNLSLSHNEIAKIIGTSKNIINKYIQQLKSEDDVANLYLISSDLSLSFKQITTLYKKRYTVEQYHKEVKQITSFGK